MRLMKETIVCVFASILFCLPRADTAAELPYGQEGTKKSSAHARSESTIPDSIDSLVNEGEIMAFCVTMMCGAKTSKTPSLVWPLKTKCLHSRHVEEMGETGALPPADP